MRINNRFLHATSSILASVLAALVVFELFVRVPMWLLDVAEPWELRSTSDHMTADFVSLSVLFLLVVTLPAVARVLYKALSPSPLGESEDDPAGLRVEIPNNSLVRSRDA